MDEGPSPVTVDSVSKVDALALSVERLTKEVKLQQVSLSPHDAPLYVSRGRGRRAQTSRRLFAGVLDLPPARAPGPKLPPELHKSTRKLDTSGTADQVLDGEPLMVQSTSHINVSPVTPVEGYRLPGKVGGIAVSFLLDTGAAVTLLRNDIWVQIAALSSKCLKQWSTASLVSVDGTPLTVHGCASVELELGGRHFMTEIVIVDPLTSEAILGLDFLQEQQALINFDCQKLPQSKWLQYPTPTPVNFYPSTVPWWTEN